MALRPSRSTEANMVDILKPTDKPWKGSTLLPSIQTAVDEHNERTLSYVAIKLGPPTAKGRTTQHAVRRIVFMSVMMHAWRLH